ncbi:Bsp6I family type II restriction endonuclease [Candidatus Pacearchaeota archaeon]|nr:Bsp6I family type II restriction endonuclease [Candidatus Pacearchaeota archaeon]
MQKITRQVNIAGQNFKADIMVFSLQDRVFIKKLFDNWKTANTGVKQISTRGINLPEAISEGAFCVFFPDCVRLIKVYGKTSGSFDVLNLKTGRRLQIKASSIPEDLTSFGPKSVWDDLYFLDFSRMDGSFDVYLIPNNLIYQYGVNRNQTFQQQQAQKRRPRFSIMKNIIKPSRLKPVKTCKL